MDILQQIIELAHDTRESAIDLKSFEKHYQSGAIIMTSNGLKFDSGYICNPAVVIADLSMNFCLMWAVRYGHMDIINELHDHGVDIRANDDEAMKIACSTNQLPIMKWLYQHGGDIRTTNDQCMRDACKHGYLQIAKWLHKNGVILKPASAERIISNAYENGHLAFVEWLMSIGIKFKPSENKYAKYGSIEHTIWLMEHGVILTEQFLLPACLSGNLELLQWLLEQNLNIEAVNDNCILYALCGGHFDILKWLIETCQLKLDTVISDKTNYYHYLSKNYPMAVYMCELLNDPAHDALLLNYANKNNNTKLIDKIEQSRNIF